MRSIKNNLILELHVPDFKQIRKFYSIFGFKEILYEPVSRNRNGLGYLVLKREDKLGNSIINFYGGTEKVAEHAHFKNILANTPRGYEVEITIPVSNVEKLWNKANLNLGKSQIAQKLELKRWGQKDFRVIDPFGFYIRFTELVNWGQ